MKRIISAAVALATVMALLLSVGVFAQEEACDHVYEALLLPADCCHPERTEYTCALCGDSYTVNATDIAAPEDFALVLRTSRTDDALTLTATLCNNPGLVGARVIAYFDPEVLSLVSYTTGEVFQSSQFIMGVNPASEHVTFYSEADSVSSPVTNNGTYFTLTFDVIGEGDYGIRAAVRNGDMSGYDSVNKKMVNYPLNIINLQGKERLGEHRYGDYIVESEPTFDTFGLEVSTCAVCGGRMERQLEKLARWDKGDLNNDKRINSQDVSIMAMLLIYGNESAYVMDAADVNGDGRVNAADSNALTRAYLGG